MKQNSFLGLADAGENGKCFLRRQKPLWLSQKQRKCRAMICLVFQPLHLEPVRYDDGQGWLRPYHQKWHHKRSAGVKSAFCVTDDAHGVMIDLLDGFAGDDSHSGFATSGSFFGKHAEELLGTCINQDGAFGVAGENIC